MRLSTLLLLLGLLALGYAKQCPRQRNTSPGKEILCYTYSNDVEELEGTICRCTTLVHQGYELHNISTAGIEELQKRLKESNPALQFAISITDPQGTLRTSATKRQEALGRLANLLSQVDGVELDMSAGSKERLTHFLKGLRDEMVRKSIDKRIMLVLPTETEQLAKQYDVKALSKYVDLFTMSTNYLDDDTESFNAFHPSRLMGIFDMLNADSLVDLVSGLGVPKKKLLISMPASAYKFTLKDEDKTVPGSPVKEERPTAISQKELCDLMSTGEWTVERDTDLTAPYAFKDSTWIAYDDKTSVGIKGKYVLLRELAGLGIHDIENDEKNDCGKPISEEVYRSFTDMRRKTRGAVLASLEKDLQHEDIPQSRHVRSSGYRIVRVVDTTGAIHAIRENTQTEFICTRQGFFVHPKSCNRFYRCVKFNQGVDDFSVFEFDCPAGLAFDERTEVCVWPGSLTDGSPCPGSSEIAPVPRSRFRCPEQPGYYADPENCRWFFACFDLGEPEMRAYEFRCPFGLVFDEEKLICEWPWLVRNCGGSGYSRTEYGSGYNAGLGKGIGYGQGSAHGGAPGYGDYIGSGLGGAGQYGPGSSGSAYTGSRGSESRPESSIHGSYGLGGVPIGGQGLDGGQFLGQGIDGAGYPGAGVSGSRYPGAKYPGSGFTGSGDTGSGYTGAGGLPGSGFGGVGSPGSKFSGAGVGSAGSGYPGAGSLSGAGYSGAGAGSAGPKFSGTGAGAGSGYPGAGEFSGAGYSGAGAGAGSGYPGAGGLSGAGYSGAGAGSGGPKFSGTGAGAGSGYPGAGGLSGTGYSGAGAGSTGPKFSGAGEGSAGSGYPGAGELSGSGYSGDGVVSPGSKFSGAGAGSAGSRYPGAGGLSGSGYSGDGAGSIGSGYSGAGKLSGVGYAGAELPGSEYADSGIGTGVGAGGLGYTGPGVTGSGFTGTGSAGSKYRGPGGAGPGFSGAGVTGSGIDGAGFSGSEYSGSGPDAGTGAGGSGYTGADVTGSGYTGTKSAGSKYPSSGAAGTGYSGAGASGSRYPGSGSSDTGFRGAGRDKSRYPGGSGSYSGSGVGTSGEGGYSGPGYTGSTSSGIGSKDSGYSGQGIGGPSVTYFGKGTTSSVYSGDDSSGTGYRGDGGFGTKLSGSRGSGSRQPGYSGQTGVYTGADGKPGVVIETVPFGTGSGFVAPGGYSPTADGKGSSTGFGSGIGDHTGSGEIGQGVAKDGLTISLETGGSPGAGAGAGAGAGVTGSGFTVPSGSGFGTRGGLNKFSGAPGVLYTGGDNNGYTTSGGIVSGPAVLTGTTGSGDGGFSVHGNTGYASPGDSVFDGRDVVNGGLDSGSVTLGGVTGSGYSGQPVTGSFYTSATGAKEGFSSTTKNPYTTPNPIFSIFRGKKLPVTPAPTVLLETVTGYSVTGSGIKSGVVYGGPFAGSDHADDGIGVTGSGFGTKVTGGGSIFINQPGAEGHGEDYNTGYMTGTIRGGPGKAGRPRPGDAGSSSTVSNFGKGGISTGTTTAHGNGGFSNTFVSSKNPETDLHGLRDGLLTTDGGSGTVLSPGDNSGTIVYQNGNRGSIFESTGKPGYVKTVSPTPGYVINGVSQTSFGQSTPGTFVTGTAAPNVVFTGTTAPGVVLHGISGPAYEGAGIRGPVGGTASVTGTGTYQGNADFSTVTTSGGKSDGGYPGGAKVTFTGTGAPIGNLNTAYETNEYHDNGGRGTITYNNGLSTSKYPEGDLRPTYVQVPASEVSGGRIEGTGDVVLGNTLAGINPYTSQGFTKTGPTKTGFTTAQIGGSGSYVTNAGYRRPSSTAAPDNIGSNAFAGQDFNKDYSIGTSIGNSVNGLAQVTSTAAPDVSDIDTSKINLGYSTSSVSTSGYTYTKPTVKFVTGSVTSSTPTPLSVTYGEPVFPLTGTTPSPHLNVEVYNTPSIVTSAPITATPAVVNTFTSRKPSGGYKQPFSPTIDTLSTSYQNRRPTFNVAYQGSGDIGQKNSDFQGQIDGLKQYTIGSTPSTIGYATRPADVYRTTLFEAAKLPATVSSVAPVFDTGYKTVISSTPTPISVTTGQYFYKDSRFDTGTGSTGQTSGNLDGTYRRPGSTYRKPFVSTTAAPSTEDGYTYEKPGKQLTYNSPSTVTPSVTLYKQPTVAVEQQGEYFEVSTAAPGFDGSFRRPSASIRPALKQPTGSQGYDYSTAGVEFVTPTSGNVYTASEGYTYRGSGGSPAELDIPQDKVKELVANYERGSVKFTPSVNVDDGAFSTGLETDYGFNSFGKKAGLTSKTYVSSTPSPIYQSTTGYRGSDFKTYVSSTPTPTYQSTTGYRGSGFKTYVSSTPAPTYQSTLGYTSGSLSGSSGYTSGSFDGSGDFGSKAGLTSKTYVSSTPVPIYQSTTGYKGSGFKTYASSTPSPTYQSTTGYRGSGFKTYVSSTLAPTYQSTLGYTSGSLSDSSEYTSGSFDGSSDFGNKYFGNKAGLTSKTYVSSTPVPIYQSTTGYRGSAFRGSTTFDGSSDFSGKYSGNRGGLTSKTYVSSTPSPIYQSTTGYISDNLGGSPGYTGSAFRGSATYDGSSDFSGKYSGNKAGLISKTYVSSTPSPIYQSTTGYTSDNLGGSPGYTGSAFRGSASFDGSSDSSGKYSGNRGGLSSKTYVSSTPSPIYQSTTGFTSDSLGGSPGYTGSAFRGSGSFDDSSDFGSKYSSNKAGLTSKTYVSSTVAPTYQSTTGFGSSGLGGSSGYRGSGYTYSTPSYEVSTAGPIAGRGKGKVIVKLSDLHPLILGKLGAQCTCRSDPFETLRGPGAKSYLIKSSKGNINLADYDESQVYVDLEADREPEQSVALYSNSKGSSTSAPPAYSSSFRTPVTAVFGVTTAAPTVFKSRGRPSTAYLPVSSTPSSISDSPSVTLDRQLLGQDSGAYGSPSDNSDAQFAIPPAGFQSGVGVPLGRSASGKGRSGKSSGGNKGAAGNAIGGEGAAFDRYGPGGWRNSDETLQGSVDCARSGIFRHPKYCNKFYACHWDEWKLKFTLHVFNCPVHLSFDSSAGACNWPTTGPACQDDNLLV